MVRDRRASDLGRDFAGRDVAARLRRPLAGARDYWILLDRKRGSVKRPQLPFVELMATEPSPLGNSLSSLVLALSVTGPQWTYRGAPPMRRTAATFASPGRRRPLSLLDRTVTKRFNCPDISQTATLARSRERSLRSELPPRSGSSVRSERNHACPVEKCRKRRQQKERTRDVTVDSSAATSVGETRSSHYSQGGCPDRGSPSPADRFKRARHNGNGRNAVKEKGQQGVQENIRSVARGVAGHA